MAQRSSEVIEVFYSYSHKDEKLRDKLATHLASLKNQGIITGWYDRIIDAGQDWRDKIDEHLNTARVNLLLVSADFLASPYCYDIEVKRAIERHESGTAHVIPVILKPCDWQGAPFGKLLALPTAAFLIDAIIPIEEVYRYNAPDLALDLDSAFSSYQ